MKRFDLLARGLLLLFIASPMVSIGASAQDDAYLTPSRAKELRKKEAAEKAALQKRMEEKRAAEMARREKARAEYQEDVKDWYNRRDMKVTIEEMEENLDQLDGTTNAQARKGGKYSNRIRRFDRPNEDRIVLQNVQQVYVLDDYDYYDPWTNSYYGRDWNSGVNIIINQGAPWRSTWDYYGYGRWGAPYYYGYYSWYDPWSSYWYDPWYYGGSRYYWGYRRPWGGFYAGWGGYYGGYYGGHYGGYANSYWNGYSDGRYDGRRDRYYSTPRSSYGRSTGRYYDRTSHNAIYGRALGNSSRTVEGSGYYDRSTRSFNGYDNANRNNSNRYNNRGYNSNNRTSRWDRNAANRNSSYDRNSTYSAPTRSSGSYSSPSRSTSSSSSSSSSGTTRTTTGRQR